MLLSVDTQTPSHTDTHSLTHPLSHSVNHSPCRGCVLVILLPARCSSGTKSSVAFACTSPKVDALNLPSSCVFCLLSVCLRISQFICNPMATCGPGECTYRYIRQNWLKLLAKVRQLCECKLCVSLATFGWSIYAYWDNLICLDFANFIVSLQSSVRLFHIHFPPFHSVQMRGNFESRSTWHRPNTQMNL